MRCCELHKGNRRTAAPGNLAELRIALRVIDLTHLPEEQAEAETRRLFNADARRLYDLGKPPLLRATLVKVSQR